MVAISHGDTSTTMLQPLAEIGALCRKHDVLLYVDCTASLGGNAFEMDAWQIDMASAGLQKCLSGPPGSAPVSFNDRAAAVVTARKHIEQGIRTADIEEGDGPIIRSNYFDLAMLMEYWSARRLNHHTEAATMLYASRECARVVLEEGLERGIARHQLTSSALRAGLTAMGLALFGDPEHRMANVTGVVIPKEIADSEAVRQADAAGFRHRDRDLVRAARRQDLADRHDGLCLPQGQCAALPDRARGGAPPQWRQARGRRRGRCRVPGLRQRAGVRLERDEHGDHSLLNC